MWASRHGDAVSTRYWGIGEHPGIVNCTCLAFVTAGQAGKSERSLRRACLRRHRSEAGHRRLLDGEAAGPLQPHLAAERRGRPLQLLHTELPQHPGASSRPSPHSRSRALLPSTIHNCALAAVVPPRLPALMYCVVVWCALFCVLTTKGEPAAAEPGWLLRCRSGPTTCGWTAGPGWLSTWPSTTPGCRSGCPPAPRTRSRRRQGGWVRPWTPLPPNTASCTATASL